ncbi:hypothetical protein [Streptomyces botrytidirepellens]|uniref:hypothetical protein n=1 Tax=Streptomyces botrytidirepellens TaxID=2486417 RepID=UPI0011CDF986|nr:hypothetical protein [Streptomyces botrytidirepellens]
MLPRAASSTLSLNTDHARGAPAHAAVCGRSPSQPIVHVHAIFTAEEKYRLLIGKMEAIALDQEQSREFIHGLIREL